jgi:glucose-1-phosphate cytidylyltransferase
MKALILAGGFGTRMGDETASRPKPLVEVGGRPILWHILKIYESHGITDFVICAGHAGHLITEYFNRHRSEPWRVEVIDTGEATATGGRVRRAAQAVAGDTFCMTYGDGVSSVDVTELVKFHRDHGKLVTVTAVQPRLPFGVVTFPDDDSSGAGFEEKPRVTSLWVNGGFFVVEPRALEYIMGDDEPWEEGPMTRIAAEGQLAARRHDGFWQCMDAPRDRQALEAMWSKDEAPWKVW